MSGPNVVPMQEKFVLVLSGSRGAVQRAQPLLLGLGCLKDVALANHLAAAGASE